MRNNNEQKSPWSVVAGGLLAAANAGALVGVVTLTVSMLAATPVFAQGNDFTRIHVEFQDLDDELDDVAREVQLALDELSETGIKIHIDDNEGDARPKLGVYLSNMDFEDAYKMRYPYAHGVLVNGTVNGGAADQAGVIEDDIVMYFDGTKVLYEDHLVRLIRSKNFGETVQLVFWRDEGMDTTMVTFVAPEKKTSDKKIEMVDKDGKVSKRKHSRGYGGGGFTPMLVQDDFVDVSGLMNSLGLSSTPFNAEGVVLLGGAGQGFVGNGWYLGGFGNGQTFTNSVTDVMHSDGVTAVDRKITFAMGLGGMTIEKRFAPFSWATVNGGVGIGGASIRLGIEQTDGSFDWNNINDQLIDTKTTAVTFSKNYALIHPRVGMMIRLTSWMRLKAEYGYLYGYSFTDGWKTTLDGGSFDTQSSDTYVLENSPETELNASTISIGLWFGH